MQIACAAVVTHDQFYLDRRVCAPKTSSVEWEGELRKLIG